MKRIYYFFLLLLICAACTNHGANDDLQRENDSLRAAQKNLEEEVDNYFAAISEISENLDRIKTMSGYISKQSENEVVGDDATARINNNIEIIADLIDSNNKQIANLTEQLRNSKLKLKGMEKAIAQLTEQNAALYKQIEELQTHLHTQSNIIASQTDTIRRITIDNEALVASNRNKDVEIAARQEKLDEVYYVYDTTKGLKAQGIIPQGAFGSKKVLQSNFNKDYFVKADINKLTQIPLYSKTAKVLTTHPSDSYILEKQDGRYVLIITDKQKFWSVSKYLVVDID